MVDEDHLFDAAGLGEAPQAAAGVGFLACEDFAHFLNPAGLRPRPHLMLELKQSQVGIALLLKERLFLTLSYLLVVLELLAESLHMLLVVVEDVLPAIACIKRVNVELVAIDLALVSALAPVELQVQGLVCVLNLIAIEQVVEKIPVDLLFHALHVSIVPPILVVHNPVELILEYLLDLGVVEHEPVVDQAFEDIGQNLGLLLSG